MKHNQDQAGSPDRRLVGRLLLYVLPQEGELVLVKISDTMTFAARMRLIGSSTPFPYWEIAGTEGERLRKSDSFDVWCYCPEINLPKGEEQ